MIDVMLTFGNEVVLVKINGNSVFLGSTGYGAQMATIEGLKLSHDGVIKEFPELKDRDDWRLEAIKRFKNKIRSFLTEKEVAEYVVEDLRKFGYVPKYLQKQGYRREVIR